MAHFALMRAPTILVWRHDNTYQNASREQREKQGTDSQMKSIAPLSMQELHTSPHSLASAPARWATRRT